MTTKPRGICIAIALAIFAAAGCAASDGVEPSEASAPPAAQTVPATTAPIQVPAQNEPEATSEPLAPEPTNVVAAPTPPQVTPTPAPTTTQIASEPEVTRSGHACIKELLDEPSATFGNESAVFTVPTNMWTPDCNTLTFADVEPVGCCGTPLSVWIQDRQISAILHELETAEDVTILNAEWVIVNTRAAWLLDLRTSAHDRDSPSREQLLAIGVGQKTLVITASDLPQNVDEARTWQAFDELIESLYVSTESEQNVWLAPPDQWCAGDRWATEIPAAWFSIGTCNGSAGTVQFNTTEIAAQCACFPPLWVRPAWSGLEDDPAVEVLSDTSSTRADGTPIRIVELIQEDDPAGRLELRAVTVLFDNAPVTVVAHRDPITAAPGHTYEDTLAAQQFIVDSIRPWRDPACATETASIVMTVRDEQLLTASDQGALIDTVPGGTALWFTGCTAQTTIGSWFEVQTTPVTDTEGPEHPNSARGENIVGWINADAVRAHEASACQSGSDAEIDPSLWQVSATGDFDGDGAQDTLLLRGNDPKVDLPRRDVAELAEAAFLFANGTTAIGPLAAAEQGLFGVANYTQVARPVGLGRDVLLVRDPFQGGAYSSQIFIIGVDGCTPIVHGQVLNGASVGNQLGYCFAPTRFGSVLRSFQTNTGFTQTFAAVRDDHLIWVDGEIQPLPEFGLGSDPLCGRAFTPQLNSEDWTGEPGPLEGVHGLSLQWLGADSSDWGEIDFRTVGPDLYAVIGRQGADMGEDGDYLSVWGIIEQGTDGELHFEGTVRSEVSYIHDGRDCLREGGQTFRATGDRRFWRMQDQINCDLISSDYIDIYFN